MASLQHLLVPDPSSASPHHAAPPPPPPPSLPAADPPAMPPASNSRPPHDRPEDANADTPRSDAPDEPGTSTPTIASVRRNASGTVSSVFAGNKVRHLKKEDGIPLWRKDIQYDFLCRVFHDDTRCFTKASDGTTDHTFADIYIDAMAKSSKCSKILKEKLLQDREGAICMAMVCLLVNVGRMNTTLNCTCPLAVPRTWHR
nr:ino eighty subunit 1 [Quercus suber]